MMSRSPHRCLFIDDNPLNVATVESIYIPSIRFVNAEGSKAGLGAPVLRAWLAGDAAGVGGDQAHPAGTSRRSGDMDGHHGGAYTLPQRHRRGDRLALLAAGIAGG